MQSNFDNIFVIKMQMNNSLEKRNEIRKWLFNSSFFDVSFLFLPPDVHSTLDVIELFFLTGYLLIF